MQVKVANLPDGPVRYLDTGSGRAIVLLHAFPLSADQWLPQLHRLPPGWRAVAPHLRGFRSDASTPAPVGVEPVTMDRYASDVLALMTRLEIDRAVVAGVSMGGYVAFAMLRRAPARVAGLLLANTRAAPDSAEGAAARDRMIALAERDGVAAVAREMLPKLLGKTTRRDQPDLEEAVRRLIEANAAEGLVSALRAMKARPDSTPLLPAIACPTMVVTGEEDALIPETDADLMCRMIPAAERRTIPGSGHLSNLEAAGAFNEAMSALLRAIPAAREKHV